MVHTFLFQEGKWKAKGELLDEKGVSSLVVGEVNVYHTSHLWVSDGVMKNTNPPFREIHNRYEITPFEDSNEETTWFSLNPAIGHLMGRFVIVGDSILSFFTSEDNTYKGFEYLLQTDHNTYNNRGVLYREGERLSSWSITLCKEA